MNWSNVKLILTREIRDQLRDRRTLFMIAVLPLVLYPLLGTSFFQVTQFMRQHPIRVLIVGAPQSEVLPPLIEDGYFAADLFSGSTQQRLLEVTTRPAEVATPESEKTLVDDARREMHEGNFEVVVYFPPDFAGRFARFHQLLLNEWTPADGEADSTVPGIEIYPNLAKDASQAAYHRVTDVLDRWRNAIGRQNLKDTKLPATTAEPFAISTRDVAEVGQHKAALWSKILPFVLLIWALTGAFYPAVDLCAGEKERGTLETLLSSPAERSEIVWGKLLTIMLFSVVTALLNLASLVITGSLVLSQIPNLGPPPGLAIVWLLVALVPMAALFSALCLAVAAFARSTKEGQYYLMPLVLATMPLVILPMAPGVELNLGSSLIPVTGVVLLLRSLLEGEYMRVLPYAPLVLAVTMFCSWIAIRWATSQFNNEAVLFRESERWNLRLWARHLLRDREAIPSFGEAVCCGLLILLIKFFMNFAISAPDGFQSFATLAAITQLVVIATPALLMTIFLTRDPARTLLLRRPSFKALAAAVGLAFALHPVANLLQTIVSRVYPLDEQLARELNRLISEPGSVWIMLLTLAVIPAICEELAFRGFILSGLRHAGHKWTAIVLSSIFFATAHALFQQSLVAFVLGLAIGFVAVQTGSLFPCIAFHASHNALAILAQQFATAVRESAGLAWLYQPTADGPLYSWPVIAGGAVAAIAIGMWLARLPYAKSDAESRQEAIDHNSAGWQPG